MKVTFNVERYKRVYGLGLEVWVPENKNNWKRLQITLIVANRYLELTLGSKKRFDEINKLFEGGLV